MAWFDKVVDGSEPQPVNLDRIKALFDRKDWYYEIRDERIISAFEGFLVSIRHAEEPFITVMVGHPEVPLVADRIDELKEWASTRNLHGTIGTCQVELDSENGSIAVLSDHTLLVNEGATEDQLEEWIFAAIEAQLNHMMLLCETFEIEPFFSGPDEA